MKFYPNEKGGVLSFSYAGGGGTANKVLGYFLLSSFHHNEIGGEQKVATL